MKNKGFTLVEMLAVIVILGLLSSIAMISYTRYRQEVREKELINLYSTIEVAYDKYRSDLLMKGEDYKETLIISEMENETFNKYFSKLSYDGKYLTKQELEGTTFSLKIKGDLLNKSNYTGKNDETSYVNDGTCQIKTAEESGDGNSDAKNILEPECEKGGNDALIPSKEELLCVKVQRGSDTLIDDYAENSKRPLCEYFN